MPSHEQDMLAGPGRISPGALGVMALLGWGLVLGMLVGPAGWNGALATTASELPVALAIFLAAGGWGWLAIRRLVPRETPDGLLVVTAVAGGLWLLGTGMLIIGTAFHGALTMTVWWPIVGVGVVLAAAGSRRRVHEIRLPRQIDGTNVLWLVGALAAGYWLAGATLPPGIIGHAGGDSFDVVSYHLQVPREYYQAGQISFLPHNTYSNYPFGGQMLFLLSMVLRGGAYEGAYAAQLTHGLWGVLAVLAVGMGLPADQSWRRRSAAALLASVPLGLYVSWMAFVELSELAYLAIGIAWLRWWLTRASWRSAAMVGLAAGGACATKYLSAGLVAGPLLLAMLAVCLARRRHLRHWLIALAGTVLLLSPWLIRNLLDTGNPAFPLATSLLGRGHWSAASASLWDAAHAPLPWDQRLPAMARELLGVNGRGFGLMLLLLVAAAIVWTILRRRRSDALDWLCLGILLMQLGVWMTATEMIGRFLLPAAVPMAILVGGMTGWLTRLDWKFRRESRDPEEPLPPRGFFLAAALVLCAVGMNLVLAHNVYQGDRYRQDPRGGQPLDLQELHGLPPEQMTNLLPLPNELVAPSLAQGHKLLLIADVHPFYFPPSTLYFTVWEQDPLLRAARQSQDPREIIRQLRAMDIRYLWVNWSEVDRLHRTYAWWPEINPALLDRLLASGARDVPLPNNALYNGRPMLQLVELPEDGTR